MHPMNQPPHSGPLCRATQHTVCPSPGPPGTVPSPMTLLHPPLMRRFQRHCCQFALKMLKSWSLLGPLTPTSDVGASY